jgi:hypothetical protein
MAAKGKLRTIAGGYQAYCLGCKEYHRIPSDRWQFNGDYDKPTFSPSVVVTSGGVTDEEGVYYDRQVCHSFIREGEWQYLDDCTHGLKGQTIPLRQEA